MTLWPAIWSAVAASCSAVAAIVLLFVHLRNARDSVRPDLVLDAPAIQLPDREDGTYFLKFEGLRNCGRGPALDIFAYVHKSIEFQTAMSFEDGGYGAGIGPFAFVAPGDSCQRGFRLWFKPRWMGEGDTRAAFAGVSVRFHAWDVHRRQHVLECTYSLMGAGGRWHVNLIQPRRWIRSRLRLFLLVLYERLMQRAPEAWKRFADRWQRAGNAP
jgi:hypothetical protein